MQTWQCNWCKLECKWKWKCKWKIDAMQTHDVITAFQLKLSDPLVKQVPKAARTALNQLELDLKFFAAIFLGQLPRGRRKHNSDTLSVSKKCPQNFAKKLHTNIRLFSSGNESTFTKLSNRKSRNQTWLPQCHPSSRTATSENFSVRWGTGHPNAQTFEELKVKDPTPTLDRLQMPQPATALHYRS